MISIERVEDKFYMHINHAMTKQHYISFIAAASSDRMQMVKLYPEGNAEARFKINGAKKSIFIAIGTDYFILLQLFHRNGR